MVSSGILSRGTIMTFTVAQGGSKICHLEVHPALPENGVAQVWKMFDTSVSPAKEVEKLDVDFAIKSSPEQRQSERMIFVFSLAQSAQTATTSWRFLADGLMYCEGKADYINDIELELSNNGKVLTASIDCPTDIAETFNFSFVAMAKENASGFCKIYASADPGGTVGRR